ncbi:MAG: NUDIX hydrolase [Ruminococcus sp.]|nr:NUDIX hydrolase [Ruminococcus sp.]
MIVMDENGNELIDIIKIGENEIDNYSPVNHALLVVKIDDDYLFGWNHFRKSWEIFGGCIENGEGAKQCIIREANEELGLDNADVTFIGLMKYKKVTDYFNPNPHIEYGGLYGITLQKSKLNSIRNHRKDRAEIEKLSLYSNIADRENISIIAEKLLEYWQ